MRRTLYQLPVIAILFLLCLALVGCYGAVVVRAADGPSLTISQLKITSSNGQFVLLYNTTDNELDMASYQLEYFNHYDITKATSSRLVALSGVVPPHGYYMLNDSTMRLCQQLTINSASLGFSSTAGMIQLRLLQQAMPGGSVQTVLQDYVGWSKAATTGAQALPTNAEALLIRSFEGQYMASIDQPGAGSWQAVRLAADNPCAFVSASDTTTVITPSPVRLLSGDEPPVTILRDAAEVSVSGAATNSGLKAPSINEILPNPDGTGNDATNEFIELYNSNDVPFDLSGYSLQVGLSTLRSYTFPAGTTLPPHSFKAFYSSEVHVSLSNSGSRVSLLDGTGQSIAKADVYGTAKDGQAWALAQGKWLWTTSPTPGAANIIREPVTKKATTKASSKKTTKGSAALPKKLSKTQAASVNGGGFQDDPVTTPVHIKTLALVGVVALLYGAYEYRRDMANRIYQLKRYAGYRWQHRPKAPWRGGH